MLPTSQDGCDKAVFEELEKMNPHLLPARTGNSAATLETAPHTIKRNYPISNDSRFPILGNENVNRKTCTHILLTAWLTTVKKSKEPRRTPSNEWINVVCPYHGMLLGSERNGILIHTIIEM